MPNAFDDFLGSFLSKGPDDTPKDVAALNDAHERLTTILNIDPAELSVEYMPVGMCDCPAGWYQFIKHETSGGAFSVMGETAREVARELERTADSIESLLRDPDLLNPINIMNAQVAAIQGDQQAKDYMMAVMVKLRQHGDSKLDSFLDMLGDD